ncbi:hypothetical protein ACH5RR_004696 [Cinchona calisaya]|uniref:Uncharacterized protein n=1 Tax=Cinchona calisaya TaxID=153742 RepID=A0ABD3AYC9_9GENT
MGRAPCCDKENVKRGPWSPEEDAKLKEYIDKSGTGGNWIALPQKAGLRRCGKSCRLRWLNYLRPNIKHGDFTDDEDRIICSLFASIGSRWSIIAAQLPGRTDNDIKNYWNTKLKKKLIGTGAAEHKKPLQSYTSISVFEPSSRTSAYQYGAVEHSYYTTTPIGSLSGYEIFSSSVPSTLLNTSSCSSINNIQEGHNLHNYQVQESSFPRFRGHEAASCTSSDGDGSSSTNQFSYGKDVEHDLQNYVYNGADDQKPYNENPLDYSSLEEIKQLISTNMCNNFFVDENKTDEKVAHYT